MSNNHKDNNGMAELRQEIAQIDEKLTKLARQTELDNQDLREAIGGLQKTTGELTENAELDREYMREAFGELRETIGEMQASLSELRKTTDMLVEFSQEARDKIDALSDAVSNLTIDVGRLAVSDENIIKYTRQVARVALASEKRLTLLEGRVSRLEE